MRKVAQLGRRSFLLNAGRGMFALWSEVAFGLGRRGLAIAIGGLVDDAVVDVENILRRMKEDRAKDPSQRLSLLALVAGTLIFLKLR